jgi:hypothetical protein
MAARKEKKERAAIGFANRSPFLLYISANVVIVRAKPEATCYFPAATGFNTLFFFQSP